MLPVSNPKPKKNNYHIKVDEVVTLLQVARDMAPKWELVALFCLLRGMRITEVLHIHKDDFLNDYTQLKIIFAKSHIYDIVPLHPVLTQKVKEYIACMEHRFREGYLFPWYTGRRAHPVMKTTSAGAMMDKLRKMAAAKGHKSFLDVYEFKKYKRYRIGWHSLRRFHQSYLYERCGKNVVLLKDLMRYRKTSSIEPYVRSAGLFNEERDIMTMAFEPLCEQLS